MGEIVAGETGNGQGIGCPQCGTENRKESKYCRECAAELGGGRRGWSYGRFVAVAIVTVIAGAGGWYAWDRDVLSGILPAAYSGVRVNARDGLRYAYVPAGTFRMGCATDADGPCQDHEKPAHEVQILKGFWMGQTEVTVEAYKRYARATGKPMPEEPKLNGRSLNPQWSFETVPMTMVDWNDARGYCEWAGLRLPTEAEWEYAARGGTTGARYGVLDDVAWYGNNSGNSWMDAAAKDGGNYVNRLTANGTRPRPVGQKRANAYKLNDMLGNVWEWTADWYGPYKGESGEMDPQGPGGGEYRVLRGGSWGSIASVVRASNRLYNPPAYRSSNIGFRCTGELTVP